MSKQLVIDGKEFPQLILTTATFDGDRVPLPARVIEFTQLSGKASVDCWLLVITAGRYRLIIEPLRTAQAMRGLARILEEVGDYGASGDVLDATGSNEQVAILARLIPTTVSPMGEGWRVTIPKEAKLLVPEAERHSFVFVMVVAGFIEFWFPETLWRAVSIPIGELLR